MVFVKNKKLKQALCFAGQCLNQLFWPAVCINCGDSIAEDDNGLCRDCWEELLLCSGADYCPHCGRDVSRFALIDGFCPDCQGGRMSFDRIARGGVYRETLRKMILAFKSGKTELDGILGFLAGSAGRPSGFYDEIELLVPVPLHWSKRLVRGYNQSFVLAKKLRHPSARIDTDLVRIRRTRSQVMMPSPAARARNVAGAFAVRLSHCFDGRNVCLVDDVKTTGATLNECAKTLKQAGASKVYAMVLAVAGQSSA